MLLFRHARAKGLESQKSLSIVAFCLSADWAWQIWRRLLWLPGWAACGGEGVHCSQSAELPERVLHLPAASAGARQHRPLRRRGREDGSRGAHRVPAGHGLLPPCELVRPPPRRNGSLVFGRTFGYHGNKKWRVSSAFCTFIFSEIHEKLFCSRSAQIRRWPSPIMPWYQRLTEAAPRFIILCNI